MIKVMIMSVAVFLSGQRTDGNLTYCYYDYYGNEYVITVPSYRLCPMSIEVDD